MKNKIIPTGKLFIIIVLCIIGNVNFFNELSAQNISTVAEIYDFDIGDIFHIEEYGVSGQYGISSIYNIEIVEKFYTGNNNDTLFYVRDIVEETTSSGQPLEYNYYIDTVFYTELDSLIQSGNIDTVFSDPEFYNGRKINSLTVYVPDYDMWIYNYVEGCGQAYYKHEWGSAGDNDYYYVELKYYKKGDEEWGTPVYVSVQENEKTEENRILVYPNPANDFFKIHTESISVTQISVYSLTGQEQIFIEDVPSDNIVDISVLSPGVYYLRIKAGDLVKTVKLLKR